MKVIVDFAFEDLARIELGDWERKGGRGAVINIPNPLLLNDSHLVEISPGGSSEPEHHLYEEMVYIVAGRGATSVWLDGGAEQTFEWHAGSLFSIPLNAWYRHFNASGTEPARYLGVTNAPPVLRWWRNRDFVFNNDFRFTDRFGGGEDYFSGGGTLYQSRKWASNFIPNAPDMQLYDYLNRGAGGVNASLEMAGNVTKAHISEFPIGTYKKAHRHGPGAHLVILSGEGFSLLWNDDEQSDLRKADWRTGGMVIVPADRTFHQHFNAGATRARYLALQPGHRARQRAPLLRPQRQRGRRPDRVRGRVAPHPRDLRGGAGEERRALPHEGLHPVVHRRGRPHPRRGTPRTSSPEGEGWGEGPDVDGSVRGEPFEPRTHVPAGVVTCPAWTRNRWERAALRCRRSGWARGSSVAMPLSSTEPSSWARSCSTPRSPTAPRSVSAGRSQGGVTMSSSRPRSRRGTSTTRTCSPHATAA